MDSLGMSVKSEVFVVIFVCLWGLFVIVLAMACWKIVLCFLLYCAAILFLLRMLNKNISYFL